MVPIWLEWRLKANESGTYHPSVTWLKENGYNPEKARGVEISDASAFVRNSREGEPSLLLRLLGFAWHDRMTGANDRLVQSAYVRAKAAGRYERVRQSNGQIDRPYALVDHRNYFALLTTAYYGRSNYYPFNRSELRTHDPEGYALVRALWNQGDHKP
jgi:hypothetical protein